MRQSACPLCQDQKGHLDRRGQHFQSFVLAEHHAFQIALKRLQFATVVVGHTGWRYAGNLGNDVFDFRFGDGFFALGNRQYALGCTCFVNHINGFVRQMPVVDVFGTELCSGLQRGHRIFDAVVLFKT